MQQEDERLASVKQYILHNYMNKIELNKLAAIAGLNPVYLGAYFKKANGCSIKQYITRIRVNNAESLLSTGGYTVSEAAMKSGFDDLFYFSKVFRNSKGYAPSVLLKGKTHS
jgi:YesN/AraC family two-component response regulator